VAVPEHSPHAQSPRELQAVIHAEREGKPFLVYRDGEAEQQLVWLDPERRMTIGRGEANDVPLPWDDQVSRAHAELETVGGEWVVVDDGLSRNGTFLNGSRITTRKRLRDGDTLRVGRTLVIYRDPSARGRSITSVDSVVPTIDDLSETQRKVLVALCRPYKGSEGFTTPATNQAIADEIFLSVDAVKTHLRTLFRKFGIEDLPQNQKRVRLVEYAFQWGLVAERDL
jgi:pSer/pThr/pTyr-binding forkhead associated (FHA) protein